MPSSRTWPSVASRYESTRSEIDRLVALAERRVDPDLLEERVHTERSRLVGDDRDDPRPEIGLADQVAQDPGEHHGRRDGRLAAAVELGVNVRCRGRQGRIPHDPLGDRPAERPPALHEVLDLLGLRPRVVVRSVLDLRVGDRQLDAVAEDLELGLGELLGLVRDVPRLDARPERPALHGLGEDDGRHALVRGGRLVRGVELAEIVTASAELGQVVVGEMLDELAQARIRPEEVLADVRAAGDRELLELPVDRVVHLLDQDAVDVARQEVVPLARPDDLDDVPARAAEHGLELLDDLAVAAHRAVEPLQVAVDDEGQVVEALAGGDMERAERLGLVGLAVAEERPDARVRGVEQAAVVQVAVEPGLVDGRDRSEAHRDRRVLPEVGHQARMRVGAEAGVPGTVSRRKWSSWSSVRRPSRNARA